MDTSQFGLLAALTYAVCMFVGVWLDRLWLAKIYPTLHKKPTLTFRELTDRIHEDDL